VIGPPLPPDYWNCRAGQFNRSALRTRRLDRLAITDAHRGLASSSTLRVARWVVRRLDECLAEIYADDLIEDGLYSPRLWSRPTESAIERLEKEADSRRRDHYRFVSSRDLKKTPPRGGWKQRAESDLFRSKRCVALAELLRARMALDDYLWPKPTKGGLELALADKQARQAISRIVRKAKSDSVGTEIADLSVCGSIPPYSDVLAASSSPCSR